MNQAIINFLNTHDWPTGSFLPFPADWSTRHYARVSRPTAPYRAVFMQAPPGADFDNFIRVDAILRSLSTSAPEIYASDSRQGFMLLEDFGDGNFGRLVDSRADPLPLLLRAVDTLIAIQKRFKQLPPREQSAHTGALPRYDRKRFINLLEPVLHNFSYNAPGAALRSLHDTWFPLLTAVETGPKHLMMRDYILDNLMDLSGRTEGRSVGLLDFELAGTGPQEYDLASLLEQVRRVLPDEARQEVIKRYLASWPELDLKKFTRNLDILSVHRHLRIFARLQDTNKLEFQRITLERLRQCLKRPGLQMAQSWCRTYLPQYFT